MNGSIYEIGTVTTTAQATGAGVAVGGYVNTIGFHDYWPNNQVTYWNSCPIYVTTDKTAKAIEILKTLQKDKIIDCENVNKFIDLVEKISGIL